MGKKEVVKEKSSFIDRFPHNNSAPPKGTKKTAFMDRFPMNKPSEETELPEERVSTKKEPFLSRHEKASPIDAPETVPIPAEDFEEYLKYKEAKSRETEEG